MLMDAYQGTGSNRFQKFILVLDPKKDKVEVIEEY